MNFCTRIQEKYPSFNQDFFSSFLPLIKQALQDQIKENPHSITFDTYSKYIPVYFPYIKNITKPEKILYKQLTKHISGFFYDHLSYWYKDYGNQLPNIFTHDRLSKGNIPMPSSFIDPTKPSTSIIQNFLDNNVLLDPQPIPDTNPTGSVTIKKGEVVFQIHGTRTIEYEGLLLTF